MGQGHKLDQAYDEFSCAVLDLLALLPRVLIQHTQINFKFLSMFFTYLTLICPTIIQVMTIIEISNTCNSYASPELL